MTRTISVGGRRVRVIEQGPPGGDPVVCVHGVGGWAENWRETLASLAAAGFRATAFDLPGFGESQRVAGARHFSGPAPLYATFVPAVLDALGLASAHLVGHSLGGAIAYIAAVSAPERFRSLTLVAPGGLGLDLPLSLRLASLPFAGLLARWVPRYIGRAGLASCFHDPRAIPAQLLEESDRYVPHSLGETMRVLRAGLTLGGVRRELRTRWMSRAERYRGPVLVVWGTEDRVIPVSHAAEAATLFPSVELRTIPAAGHLVMVERPVEFAATLLPFLRAAAAGPGSGADGAATITRLAGRPGEAHPTLRVEP